MSDFGRQVKHVDDVVDVLQRVRQSRPLYKVCRVCGGRLGNYERRYHKGWCALKVKSAMQKERRELARNRASASSRRAG